MNSRKTMQPNNDCFALSIGTGENIKREHKTKTKEERKQNLLKFGFLYKHNVKHVETVYVTWRMDLKPYFGAGGQKHIIYEHRSLQGQGFDRMPLGEKPYTV